MKEYFKNRDYSCSGDTKVSNYDFTMILLEKVVYGTDLRGKSIILLNQNETYVQCDSRSMVKSHLEIKTLSIDLLITYHNNQKVAMI